MSKTQLKKPVRHTAFMLDRCFKHNSNSAIVPSLKFPAVNISRVLGLSSTSKFRPDELLQVND